MSSSNNEQDYYEHEYEPERFTIDGRFSLEVLAVVPPPLEYMATLHTRTQEISGRKVWCGSLLLAHVLATLDPKVVENKRVLELGSGTGLVGMTASRLGTASCVVLTDGDVEAMNLLQQNLRNPFNEINTSTTQATLLKWGDQQTEFERWCRESFPQLNNNDLRFDVILAGDVMYKKQLPELFFETVNWLLSKQGTLWLCHVPRASVTHEVLQQAARDAGFVISVYNTQGINVQDCPLEDRERALVYQVTRSGSNR